MSKRDMAVVAVILAAAMAAGLVAVRFGLDRANRERDAAMELAQSNAGAAPGEGAEEGIDPGDSTGAPDDSAGTPGGGTGTPGASGDDIGTSGGDIGTSGGGTGTSGGESGAGSPASALEEAIAAGNFSDPEVLIALGLLEEDSLPSMGAEDIDLTALTRWMTESSLEALEAKAALEAARAIAAGVGSGDNPERRAFAQAQGDANFEAARNGLEQAALELCMDYLVCRELLAIQGESLAFYLELERQIAAQAAALPAQATAAQLALENATDDNREERQKAADLAAAKLALVQEDAEWVAGLIAQTGTAIEQAERDLTAAAQAINQAVGNQVTAPLTVEGELTVPALPAMSEDEAVAGALANRNELKGAAFEIVRAEKELTRLRYLYAPNSREVLEQQAALEEAQAALPAARIEIEGSVRALYSGILQTSARVEQSAATVERLADSGAMAPYELTGSTADGCRSNAAALAAGWSEYIDARRQIAAGSAQLHRDLLRLEHAAGVGAVSADI